MQRRIAYAVLLICILAVTQSRSFGQQESGYAVTDFLSATFFREIRVSPDAAHVAFITSKNNFLIDRTEAIVWKIDVDTAGRKIRMTRITPKPGGFSNIKWSSDGRYLAFKSVDPNSQTHLVAFDIKANKSFTITTEKKFKNGITAFDWSADGRRIYFAVNDVPPPPRDAPVSFPAPAEPDDHSTFYRLAVTDFGRKDPQPLASINNTAAEFALSPDEKWIAFRPGRALFLLETTGQQTTRRLTPRFPCLDQGIRWTAKGIVFQACGGMKDGKIVRTQRRLYRVDATSGHMERLAPEFTGEFWAQEASPDGGVFAIGVVSTKWGLYYIEPSNGKALEVQSNVDSVRGVSVAMNGKLAAFVTMDNPELYLARDVNRIDRATKVTDFNAKFNQMPKPIVETIRWKNNEGETIEGVLRYPPGKKGTKGLPLILEIHGGPWSTRTESNYAPLAENPFDLPALFASRGYLVLSPNYRGSAGRGDAFLKALDGYPCSRPSVDVLTGVDYVVAQGWADPQRLGVMGASYGGRITNCVIGQTNRFKAAVSVAGFWNLTSAVSDSGSALSGFDPIVPPWQDMRQYWEESPISHAANIKTPTMIIIGGDDTAVSPAQAREQQRALDWLEVPNSLLLFPGAGHGLGKPSNMRVSVEARIAWLDHYILGKPLPQSK